MKYRDNVFNEVVSMNQVERSDGSRVIYTFTIKYVHVPYAVRSFNKAS
jgi:hypothetical protein